MHTTRNLRALSMALAVWLLLSLALPVCAATGAAPYRAHASDTLKITIERLDVKGIPVYISHIWVEDPAQICKETAVWRRNLATVGEMVQGRGAVLAVNGSGFLSPTYPSTVRAYGPPEQNHYTSLGSVVVTHGEVFREIESLHFTGIALEEDGLALYLDVENADVLAGARETWAFVGNCVLIRDGEIVLPEPTGSHESSVSRQFAPRTVIARQDANNYLIFSIRKDKDGFGFDLQQTAALVAKYGVEWAFNLDGGGSTALLFKEETLAGGQREVFDCLYFVE